MHLGKPSTVDRVTLYTQLADELDQDPRMRAALANSLSVNVRSSDIQEMGIETAVLQTSMLFAKHVLAPSLEFSLRQNSR